VIATLWPVPNDVAAEIGASLARRLHSEDRGDVTGLLGAALNDVVLTRTDGLRTAAAYIYVGLPGPQVRTRRPVGPDETLALLTAAFNALYGCLGDIVQAGKPELAAIIHSGLVSALGERIAALVVPGEVPPHLPWPMSAFSALDFEFVRDMAELALGREMLQALPHESQRHVVDQMSAILHDAVRQLATWEERHARHLGQATEDRPDSIQGIPARALGEAGFILIAAKLVLGEMLPFVRTLTEFHDADLDREARMWLQMAALLVTTPGDVSEDGSVTDDALIGRIREGVLQEHRVVWSPKGDSGGTTSIDLLAQAVDKSELANRFGVACLHLGDHDRAVRFFELARDLAEPNSPRYANALSNLANALRQSQAGAVETLASFHDALVGQEAAGDARNAAVTLANMLRLASRSDVMKVEERLIDRILAMATAIQPESAAANSRCDILGAAAAYHASRGQHARAAALTEEIARLLDRSGPGAVVHMSELPTYYYDSRDYVRAASRAMTNAELLERAHLYESAARSYGFAAQVAARAYDAHRSTRNLVTFLDCSQRLARLLRSRTYIGAVLGDFPQRLAQDTKSLWKQFGDRHEIYMALRAYAAKKSWDGREEPDWEMLSYAYHPRNLAAVRTMAHEGVLRREARVGIRPDSGVSVEVSTLRQDAATATDVSSYPDVVFGSILVGDLTVTSVRGVTDWHHVAGALVFQLRDREGFTFEVRQPLDVLIPVDQVFAYRDVWGSRLIPYRLEISLAPGLVPIPEAVRVQPLSGDPPEDTIRFRSGHAEIVLQAEGPGWTPWLCDFRWPFEWRPRCVSS